VLAAVRSVLASRMRRPFATVPAVCQLEQAGSTMHGR
jgi:hypothetical protein